MEVGETMSIDVTGDAIVAGIATGTRVQGEIRVEEYPAAVETGMGVVHGCKHFSGYFTLSGDQIPAVLASATVEADLWYHDQYGVAAVSIRMPPLEDVIAGLAGAGDWLDLPGGYRMVQKVGTLDASHGSFLLDTYDFRQTFDADKDTHAKMILELRFTDEVAAKTELQPSVSIEFGTVFGIYPSELIKTDFSFFHPDENGQGFVYWIAFVDQAAKNETANPIAYHISAYSSSVNEKVRATARIIYKVLE